MLSMGGEDCLSETQMDLSVFKCSDIMKGYWE